MLPRGRAEGAHLAASNPQVPPFAVGEKTDFQQDCDSLVAPADASVCYAPLVGTLLDGDTPLLAICPTGEGKAATVLHKLPLGLGPRHEPTIVAFGAQTRASHTPDVFDGKSE